MVDYGINTSDPGGGGAWYRHITNYRNFFSAQTNVRIINWYYDIRNNGDANPNAIANAQAMTCTPMISYNTGNVPLADIADDTKRTTIRIATKRYNGVSYSWDPETETVQEIFRRMAAGYANKGTLLFRLNWEMNLNYDPTGQFQWVATPGSPNTPAAYKTAWQKIHAIFQAQGAANVKWVWCPNVKEAGVTAGNLWDYYPGDAYVDYVGLDGYGYGNYPYGTDAIGNPLYRTYRNFETIYRDSYNEIVANTTKPLIIGETGVYHFDYRDPGMQNPPIPTAAQWLNDAFLVQIPTRYPRIRAICYYNIDARFNDFEFAPDWRVLDLAGELNLPGDIRDGAPDYETSESPTRPPNVQEFPPGRRAWEPFSYLAPEVQAINDKATKWGEICRTPYYTRAFP